MLNNAPTNKKQHFSGPDMIQDISDMSQQKLLILSICFSFNLKVLVDLFTITPHPRQGRPILAIIEICFLKTDLEHFKSYNME